MKGSTFAAFLVPCKSKTMRGSAAAALPSVKQVGLAADAPPLCDLIQAHPLHPVHQDGRPR
eukprot:5735835-Alexandrium_andersonii.AAC.1